MKHWINAIEFLILFSINGVMLWFFHSYFNLVMGIVMVLLLIGSLWCGYLVMNRVTCRIHAPLDNMDKGKEFRIYVELENPLWLSLPACYLMMEVGNEFLDEREEVVITMPLGPKNTSKASYPLSSKYVGDIKVKAVCLFADDWLGLRTTMIPLKNEVDVLVMPQGKGDAQMDLNAMEPGMEEAEESKLKGSDFSDVSEIREYIPGDSMKDIHWKLSAKKDEWMVKERLRMSSKQMAIVLELNPEEVEYSDENMELLYGIGKQCLASRVPIEIWWWNARFGEISHQKVESNYDLEQTVQHIIYDKMGQGFMAERFRAINPGKSFLLIHKGSWEMMGA